ncbi:MAG: DUF1614 domain-containing protein [Candidatus Omnitrophica bacterium]|nr:DUF1614 domain-containing protein [Candidatus Omnitrophota bacterium]
MPLGCLPLLLFLWFIFLLPIFFADLMLTALGKLGLSPSASIFIAFWIFFGGLINIPVKHIARPVNLEYDPLAMFGLGRFIPRKTILRQTIIAVNVGGCVVPCLVALYEMVRLTVWGPWAVLATVLTTGLNVYICYKVARPLPQVGIVMPPIVPALAAALSAVVLLPEMAAPVAFIAGVLGPLIGADLLHLDDIVKMDTPMGSIGGAGTFDGIVISGLVATLLA